MAASTFPAFVRPAAAVGSSGTASWGSAVVQACRELLGELAGRVPELLDTPVSVLTSTEAGLGRLAEVSRHSYGAQFVAVRVDGWTGEVRVDRMVGVFAAGRIVNAATARSQLVGGMTMGLSTALLEDGLLDHDVGGFAHRDLGSYHVACSADVPDIEVHQIEGHDETVNPVGVKGVGELGMVGTAAAVVNAVHHAVGVRVRELPVRMEELITG